MIVDLENKKITLLDGSIRSLYLTGDKKYYRFKLNNKHITVHRYIAENFLEKKKGDVEVNHIDGNTFNNAVSNLEWCSKRHNLHHAMDSGLHAKGRTKIIGTNIKTGESLTFNSQADAVNNGFTQPNINKCLKGIRPTHKGYTWKYLEDSV